jgi:hypothetical protein
MLEECMMKKPLVKVQKAAIMPRGGAERQWHWIVGWLRVIASSIMAKMKWMFSGLMANPFGIGDKIRFGYKVMTANYRSAVMHPFFIVEKLRLISFLTK